MAQVGPLSVEANSDMVREVKLSATAGNSGKPRTLEIETYLFYDELKELVCFLTLAKQHGSSTGKEMQNERD